MVNLNKKRIYYRRRLSGRNIILSSIMAALTIGFLGYLSQHTGHSFILPSFGASTAILFITPQSSFARPRNIVFSHLLTSILGVFLGSWLGSVWWALGLATGCSVLLMQIFKVVHPPAAANPLLIMLQGSISWTFVINPVLLGGIVLTVVAFIYRRILQSLDNRVVRPDLDLYLLDTRPRHRFDNRNREF